MPPKVTSMKMASAAHRDKTQARKILLSLLLLLQLSVGVETVRAQYNNNILTSSVLSSDVAAETRSNQVNVSLYTGQINLNIPLLEQAAETVGSPISLSYAGSGVKADELAGTVGSNWSIKAGGTISRIVRSYPDEFPDYMYYTNGVTPRENYKTGFYFERNRRHIAGSDWNTHAFGYALSTMLSGKPDKNYTERDLEPDEFLFDFCGYSGRFFFNVDGQISVESSEPLIVSFNQEFIAPDKMIRSTIGRKRMTWQGRKYAFETFSGFTIETPDGSCYVFGGDFSTMEFSIDFFKQNMNVWIANAWKLKRIIHKDGSITEFEYERRGLISQFYLGRTHNLYTSYKGQGQTSHTTGEFISDFREITASGEYQGALLLPAYLSSISRTGMKIGFFYERTKKLNYVPQSVTRSGFDFSGCPYIFDPGDNVDPGIVYPSSTYEDPSTRVMRRALDSMRYQELREIRVYEDRVPISAIGFRYNKETNQRLFLMGIDSYIFDLQKLPYFPQNSFSADYLSDLFDKQPIASYQFSYCEREKLPASGTFSSDGYGYYIGREQDRNSFYRNYGNPPSEEAMRYGALSSIRYPEGGRTDFVYEANRFSMKVRSENREAAPLSLEKDEISSGLRIKSISHMNTDGSLSLKRSFSYNNSAGKSSGILLKDVSSFFKLQTNQIPHYSGSEIQILQFRTQNTLSSSYYSRGYHIGYSHVQEESSDGITIRYKFSNYENPEYRDKKAHCILFPNLDQYYPYNSRENSRGLLLWKEEIYNGTNKIRIGSSYEYTPVRRLPTRSISVDFFMVRTGTGYSLLLVNTCAYSQDLYAMLLSKETKSTTYGYIGFPIELLRNSISQEKTCEYNDSGRLIREKFENGKGKLIEKRYEYTPPGFFTHFRSYFPLKKFESYVNGQRAEEIRYDYSEVTNQHISPLAPFHKTIPIQTEIHQAIGTGEMKRIKKNLNFDSYGNPIESIDERGESSVMIYCCQGKYLAALIENATLEEVQGGLGSKAIAAFSDDPSADLKKIELLRQSDTLKKSRITTYGYGLIRGLNYRKDPDGRAYHFFRDGAGRLRRIQEVINGQGVTIEQYDYQSESIR